MLQKSVSHFKSISVKIKFCGELFTHYIGLSDYFESEITFKNAKQTDMKRQAFSAKKY